MSDTAIKVENLSKRYLFDCAQGRLLSLKEELPDTSPSTLPVVAGQAPAGCRGGWLLGDN